jgi:hypothetical protein
METRMGRVLTATVALAVFAFGAANLFADEEKAKETGAVKGKITYKGVPLTGGTVSFYAADASIYTTLIAADGSYSLKDVPVGEMRVAVETESLNKAKPKVLPKEKAPADPSKPDDKPATVIAYVKIPKKYSDPKTSGLTCKIKKGNQTFDIALED